MIYEINKQVILEDSHQSMEAFRKAQAEQSRSFSDYAKGIKKEFTKDHSHKGDTEVSQQNGDLAKKGVEIQHYGDSDSVDKSMDAFRKFAED